MLVDMIYVQKHNKSFTKYQCWYSLNLDTGFSCFFFSLSQNNKEPEVEIYIYNVVVKDKEFVISSFGGPDG